MKASTLGKHKQSRYVNIFDWGNIEKCFYFNGCACNEFDGLTRRHLIPQLKDYDPVWSYATIGALSTMDDVASEFSKAFETYPVSHEELMAHTRVSLKKRYQRAYDVINYKRLTYQEIPSGINAFVKIEKMAMSKIEKPPRMIQYRDFKFTYMMKKWQVLMSKQLAKTDRVAFGQRQSTAFTKNFNNQGVAKVLRDSWDSFRRPVALCLDHSTWDAHVTQEMLSIEHDFWLQSLGKGKKRKYFADLMLKQLNNRGRTKGGILYKVKGSRMSGEFSTSDGNCILNYSMLATWLIHHNVIKYRIHVNGDDSVIIIDTSEMWKLNLVEEGSNIAWFRRLNMETKLDRIALDFRQIEFCQASPLSINNTWKMIRKPLRVISRSMLCEEKWYKTARLLRDFVGTLGLCELAQNIGVPILQSWSLYLLSYMTRSPVKGVDFSAARLHNVDHLHTTIVTDQARSDFVIAFGISIPEQLQIEAKLAAVTKIPPQEIDHLITKYSTYHRTH